MQQSIRSLTSLRNSPLLCSLLAYLQFSWLPLSLSLFSHSSISSIIYHLIFYYWFLFLFYHSHSLISEGVGITYAVAGMFHSLYVCNCTFMTHWKLNTWLYNYTVEFVRGKTTAGTAVAHILMLHPLTHSLSPVTTLPACPMNHCTISPINNVYVSNRH